MATIYSRIDKNGNKRFYGSIYHNGKRIRKSLGCSLQSAEALIKKLEYELLFNIYSPETKPHIPCYEKAILSFLKEVERTSVKVKQVSDIHTKLNYFKDYCFSIGIRELNEISRSHANTYIVNRSPFFGFKAIKDTRNMVRLSVRKTKLDSYGIYLKNN